jgi:hypothetical protein
MMRRSNIISRNSVKFIFSPLYKMGALAPFLDLQKMFSAVSVHSKRDKERENQKTKREPRYEKPIYNQSYLMPSPSSSSSSSSSHRIIGGNNPKSRTILVVLLASLLILSSLASSSVVNADEATCADSGTTAAVDDDEDDDPITARLLDWLRENGAYINEKLIVRRVDPNDVTSPRGVFAMDDIDVGETVCAIPWNLMIKPSEGVNPNISTEDDCLTLDATYDAIRGGDRGEITPYARYLLAQPRDYLPSFWSEVRAFGNIV